METATGSSLCPLVPQSRGHGVDLARAEVVSRGRAGREGCSRSFPSGQLTLALLGPLQDAQGRKEAQAGDWKGQEPVLEAHATKRYAF